MDYFIPEKAPQPSNVLESLVWDREKEIDKMRERFQLARALAQAKASAGKFPSRLYINFPINVCIAYADEMPLPPTET